MVALGKPTERETRAWYFQRYVSHLPLEGEMVLFNRSWYNRAGVEKVMSYCTEREYREFMDTVNDFEDLLIRSGLSLLKYYLDITRDEQRKRLVSRRKDPLKQWKISPVDDQALEFWDDYSRARNAMFKHTSTKSSPWMVVKADHKKIAHLNVIRDILSQVDCPDKDEHLIPPDTDVVRKYHSSLLKEGWITP